MSELAQEAVNEAAVTKKTKSKKLEPAKITSKRDLERYPKVAMEIPEDRLNPQLKSVPVCINGIVWPIPVGQLVEVPEPVYRVYQASVKGTQAALHLIKDDQEIPNQD